MPLRSANEPYSVVQIMTALATIMTPNTLLAQVNGTVAIDTRDPLYQSTAVYPAICIYEGPQSSARIHYRLWQPKIVLDVVYYQRWDQSASTLSTIWSQIDVDLRRMKANLEDNPRLQIGSINYAVDIALITLTPFIGQINDKDFPIPMPERAMSIQINVAPYASAG